MQNTPHYIEKIVALAQRQPVLTVRPVHAENGIKLVDSGVHISPALHAKLAAHKLLLPLDECLAVDNAVSAESIAATIAGLLDSTPFAALLDDVGERERLLAVFARLPLNPVLAFKLTVAREEAPGIYRHSLEVALCAVLLAMHTGAPPQEITHAAAGGLFHDIGLLHINSEFLDSEHTLSDQERHHIYAHPVLAHLVLERFPEWAHEVARAVLEHHERLDASGYPRGLAADAISTLGQLLAVAELAATLISGQSGTPAPEDIRIVLRLNQGKLNHQFANALIARILPRKNEPAPHAYAQTLSSLVEMSASIQDWHSIARLHGEQEIVGLISQRVERLERNLADLGVDLQFWGMIDASLHEDRAALHELAMAAREGRWQLRAIAQEIHRHWPALSPLHPLARESIWAWSQRAEGASPQESQAKPALAAG